MYSKSAVIKIPPLLYVGLEESARNKILRHNKLQTGLTMDIVMDVTCEITGVSKFNVLSRSRLHEHVIARTIFEAVSRNLISIDVVSIGNYVNRGHGTVVSTIQKHERWVKHYPKYANLFMPVYNKCSTYIIDL
jgi:chromosomal replication initiation ATPase DnaA